jgi:hypothetical protein
VQILLVVALAIQTIPQSGESILGGRDALDICSDLLAARNQRPALLEVPVWTATLAIRRPESPTKP